MSKKSPAKVDPEKLKEMFNEWKASKECISWYFNMVCLAKMWDELLEIIKDNKDAESIEDDFTEHYSIFLYKLHAFSEEVKAPKRSKSTLNLNFLK